MEAAPALLGLRLKGGSKKVQMGPLTGRLAGPFLAVRFEGKLHERTFKVLTRLCKGDDDPYRGLKGHLR